MKRPASILTLNLGSTTVKASLFERSHRVEAGDPVFALTLPLAEPSKTNLTSETGNVPTNTLISDTDDRKSDVAGLLDKIAGQIAGHGVAPTLIAHRIVHGGDFRGPCALDARMREALAGLEHWAPSHQRAALALAVAATDRWPAATALAAFDTDWHRTLPALTRTLPLSATLRANGLRRYGFHGLAFRSAWRKLCAAEPNARQGRTVLAHLGGGASLCAVADGQSVDTTMSLTPLDGLPMATRCGSLDPGVILHLLRTQGLSPDAIEIELSQRSGLRGLSGTTGDMQQLLAGDAADEHLAVDIFVHRAAQGIAAMATTLGGIDDLVFSGGIGTHAAPVRAAIVRRLAWIGLQLDVHANDKQALRIDAPGSASRVWVVDAREDQELAMAAAEWLTTTRKTDDQSAH